MAVAGLVALPRNAEERAFPELAGIALAGADSIIIPVVVIAVVDVGRGRVSGG